MDKIRILGSMDDDTSPAVQDGKMLHIVKQTRARSWRGEEEILKGQWQSLSFGFCQRIVSVVLPKLVVVLFRDKPARVAGRPWEFLPNHYRDHRLDATSVAV
jgi:hypothetical protein